MIRVHLGKENLKFFFSFFDSNGLHHFMSGLAVFGLKYPSLLDYDRKRSDNGIAKNLHDLYLVNTPPSDTYLRERLDDIDQVGRVGVTSEELNLENAVEHGLIC